MVTEGVGLREKALAAWDEHQRQMIEEDARRREEWQQQRLSALENQLQHYLGLNVEVTEEPCVIDGIPFGFPDDGSLKLGVWQSCPDCGEYRVWEEVSLPLQVGRILAECIRFTGADDPQTVRQEPCDQCVRRYERQRGVERVFGESEVEEVPPTVEERVFGESEVEEVPPTVEERLLADLREIIRDIVREYTCG